MGGYIIFLENEPLWDNVFPGTFDMAQRDEQKNA